MNREEITKVLKGNNRNIVIELLYAKLDKENDYVNKLKKTPEYFGTKEYNEICRDIKDLIGDCNTQNVLRQVENFLIRGKCHTVYSFRFE